MVSIDELEKSSELFVEKSGCVSIEQFKCKSYLVLSVVVFMCVVHFAVVFAGGRIEATILLVPQVVL
jgi:hypothetical protein